MTGQKGLEPPSKGSYSVCELDTASQRALFAEHLEQILASPVFRNSKRYASVFRYVVERALEGNPDRLKERTIGIDVFGRHADYDTASDHVVRSAMAEVRKRLAQYYQDDDHSEVRIEIQPGSYVPQFRVAGSHGALVVPEAEVPEAQTEVPSGRNRWKRVVPIAAAAACLAIFLAVRGFVHEADPVAVFWGPIFSAPSSILLCVGNIEGGQTKPPSGVPQPPVEALTMRAFHVLPSQTIHIGDAKALARFAGLLESHGKTYRVATQTEANFQDLQNGPAILIGLLNNDWTERLVGKLRFTVERPAPGKVILRDSQNPSRTDWSMDYLTPVNEITKDFAIVVRALDPKTDQMVVMVGGISVFGTLAASEFLTSARDLERLETQAPKGWRERNVELVLATDVIRGRSGHARIVASHFW
ncbi:MAG: hypothetical protein JO099_10515 [Acidobacteriia bacterium]|nr:hypothetical protein [Terriglobia bacterium]